jgi:hypothetical protein
MNCRGLSFSVAAFMALASRTEQIQKAPPLYMLFAFALFKTVLFAVIAH